VANSSIITAAHIRQQFAGTSMPADPTDTIQWPGSQHWPNSLREQLSGDLTPAGVLIPVLDSPAAGLSVLLTQRSAELKNHGGQISFPGGRMEPEDRDIACTALRETREEVGIGSEHVTVVGYLAPMPTISGYAVTPIVGLVSPAAVLEVDRNEVEFAFEVPLSFLLEPHNRCVVQRELHGKSIPMMEFHYEQHRIWGATAMMLLEFLKVIKNKEL
jgi:8-oxo-dGTP pyrophosphatase MutT (NUDIX family)